MKSNNAENKPLLAIGFASARAARSHYKMNGNQKSIWIYAWLDGLVGFTLSMMAVEMSPLRNAVSDFAPVYGLVLGPIVPIGVIIAERARARFAELTKGQKRFTIASWGLLGCFALAWLCVFVMIIWFVAFEAPKTGR